MSRFDVVSFVGGPLDGVCWPCILNPEFIGVRTTDGKMLRYEVDVESENADGTKEYRACLTTDPDGWLDEFLEGIHTLPYQTGFDDASMALGKSCEELTDALRSLWQSLADGHEHSRGVEHCFICQTHDKVRKVLKKRER